MKNVHINIVSVIDITANEIIKASNLNCSAKKTKKASRQYDLASYKNKHLLKLASEKKVKFEPWNFYQKPRSSDLIGWK